MAFWNDIGEFQEVYGVELFQCEGLDYLHYVLLEKKKGELDILQKEQNIPLMDFWERMDKNIPVALFLNVKGIIHKETKGSIETSDSEILHQIIPDAKLQIFHIQTLQSSKGIVGSIIRKNAVENILKKWENENIYLIHSSIGFVTLSGIIPFLEQKNLAVEGFNITFNSDDSFSHFKKEISENEMLRIGEETVSSYLTPAISVGFAALMKNESSLPIESLDFNKNELKNKSLIRIIGLGGLMIFLLLLLGSFLWGTILKDKNQNLQRELFLKQEQLKKLDNLETKAKQYSQVGGIKPSKVSWYLDRMAQTVPSKISLVKVEVFPLKGDEKDYFDGRLLAFHKNKIHIKGEAKNALTYNQWLKKIAKEKWIEEVEHIQYEDVGEDVGEFQFSITIQNEGK